MYPDTRVDGAISGKDILRDDRYWGIFVVIFCLISTTLSFAKQSAENKVLNIESALHNEISLKI